MDTLCGRERKVCCFMEITYFTQDFYFGLYLFVNKIFMKIVKLYHDSS